MKKAENIKKWCISRKDTPPKKNSKGV